MATREPSGSLRAYVAAIVAVGSLALAASLGQLAATPHPLECLLFAACAVMTGNFRVKIPGASASISVSDTFFITAALLFGPAPATLALAVDSAVMSWRLKHPFHRVAFNAAAPALSMFVAAHAFFAAARVPPLTWGTASIQDLPAPLLLLVATYFVLNSGLTACAVAIDTAQSPFALWRSHFMWLSIGYFAAGSVSFCLTIVISQIGFTAIAIVLPLVAIFHLTLRSSFGRLDDARRHLADLDRLYVSTVETLAMAIDAKDDVTHSHVRRVQAYASGLARALGVTDQPTLKAIEAAALLHDTGKLAVPEHILNKPGKLTPAEYEQMKLHVDVGADILAGIDFPFPVVPIVRCHHENWDGSGYPRGIAGEEIPIGARILSVVDCFDALTSDRPYRRRLTPEAALDILRERRGSMYDPRVVDTFVGVHRELAAGVPADSDSEHSAFRHISRAAVPAEPAAEPIVAAPADDSLAAFASLARIGASGASVWDVLTLGSTLLSQQMPTVTAAWYVYDSSSDRLQAMTVTGPAGRQLHGIWMSVGERLTGWVAAQRQPAINSDPALDLGDLATRSEPPLRSSLSVPLAAGSTLAGVLTLYAPGDAAFSDADLRRLQSIAPHVTAAITAATSQHKEPSATFAPTAAALRTSTTVH